MHVLSVLRLGDMSLTIVIFLVCHVFAAEYIPNEQEMFQDCILLTCQSLSPFPLNICVLHLIVSCFIITFHFFCLLSYNNSFPMKLPEYYAVTNAQSKNSFHGEDSELYLQILK